MKPILLATDGSPSAQAATDEAFALAGALGAPVVGVCVAHVTLPAYAGYYGYGEIAYEMQMTEKAHVQEVLSQLRDSAAEAGVTCTTVGLDGPAAAAICHEARERDARMIVIGSHGWGRAGRLLHGSVSTAVLHEAPCPVYVVHATGTPGTDAGDLAAAASRV